MITIESLNEYGADTKTGLQRCLNNEAFYLRLVNMELNDQNFARLEAALNENNAREAFEAAHALKGALGNLALTPIYEPVASLTELLRGKDEINGADTLATEIFKAFEALKAL